MTRNNLAVCFSPVIFCLNFDYKKKSKSRKYLPNSGSTSSNLHKIAPSLITSPSNQHLATPDSNLSAQEKNSFEQTPTSFLSKTNLLPVASTMTTMSSNLSEQKRNSSFVIDSKSSKTFLPQQQNRLLSVPNASITNNNQASTSTYSSSNSSPSSPALNSSSLLQSNSNKTNSKRKYSDKFNKAASSIVNFGVELSSSKTSAFFSDSIKENLENLEYMNRVVQLCVSDMIKYSMDLFTVSLRSFFKN